MSTHLTVQAKVGKTGFTDVSPHRQHLAVVYNQYQAVGEDDGLEAHKALLQPLFITSFLIEDFLDESALFGARSVVLSSASSKTAIGLAFLLKRRGAAKVVGLTSPRNAGFVEGLVYYDQVVAYEELPSAPIERPVVFVDFAGDAAVRRAVHETFDKDLAFSSAVGGTHWEAERASGDVPGVKPVFFFAPDRIAKRRVDWAPGEFETRYGAAWAPFVADAPRWLKVERSEGRDAMREAYLAQVEGRSSPDVGVILAP